MKRALFKQSDMTRAFKCAREAGYDDVRVDVSPDGTMSVIVGSAAKVAGRRNSFDELMS